MLSTPMQFKSAQRLVHVSPSLVKSSSELLKPEEQRLDQEPNLHKETPQSQMIVESTLRFHTKDSLQEMVSLNQGPDQKTDLQQQFEVPKNTSNIKLHKSPKGPFSLDINAENTEKKPNQLETFSPDKATHATKPYNLHSHQVGPNDCKPGVCVPGLNLKIVFGHLGFTKKKRKFSLLTKPRLLRNNIHHILLNHNHLIVEVRKLKIIRPENVNLERACQENVTRLSVLRETKDKESDESLEKVVHVGEELLKCQ
ncbi:unnamed protein product [Spodoptera exigua]|nr:unnamed protein product [Spodoptera exigua]